MEIICLTVGDLATNCYLVTDEDTRETIIVDPGDEGDFISTTLLEHKLIPKAIILTHGHYDHCLATLELKLNFSLPIYLHPKDLFLYEKAHQSSTFWSNKSSLRGRQGDRGNLTPPPLPPIDHFLVDNQVIALGNSSFKVLHTPGHTPGSCCFLVSPVKGRNPRSESGERDFTSYLFTGDTLFESGIGSTDHKYSSRSDLQKSLKKISDTCDLSSTIHIYPGHESYDVGLCNLLIGK